MICVAIAAGTGGSALASPPGWELAGVVPGFHSVFVDPVNGDDHNDGYSPSLTSNQHGPKQHLADDAAFMGSVGGYSLLRDGYTDWLFLVNTDTFSGRVTGSESITFQGRAGVGAGEWMGIGSYGTSRAVVELSEQPSDPGWFLPRLDSGDSDGYIAMFNLDFRPQDGAEYTWVYVYDWHGGPDPVDEPGGGSDLLVQNCRFTSLFRSVSIESVTDFTVRGCVFKDWGSWWTSGYSPNCCYFAKCAGLVSIEDCIAVSRFHELGEVQSHERLSWGQDSSFYTAAEEDGDIDFQFKRNILILTTGSDSHHAGEEGLQMRCAASVDDCLFSGCHTAISIGQVVGLGPPFPGGVYGHIRGCVILNGIDLSDDPADARGIGITVSNCHDLEISKTLFANKTPGTGSDGAAINFDTGRGSVDTVLIENCTVYNWCRALEIQHSDVTNVTVSLCYFVNKSETETLPLIDVYNPSNCSFSGNTYYDARGQTATIFHIRSGPNAGNHDFAWWNHNVENDTATWGEPGFPHPTRTLDSFAAANGCTDQLGLMAALAGQQQDAWNDDISIDALLD